MSDSDNFTNFRNSKFRLVSGMELFLIWTGVILTILKVALGIEKHPVRVFKLLRSVIRERKSVHDNSGRSRAFRAHSKYYWSVNIPGWPSEKLNSFIRNELLRSYSPEKQTLQTIILSITNICPLHCVHCYESDNLSETNKMSLENLKRIMDKIRDKGIRHIQFSGGEPLSRFEDMIELMNHSGKANDYWISTSGFGLTSDKAFRMKKSGMTGALISLDHWDESRHNAFRGHKESFSWVIKAVNNCHKAGIIVCLSLCPVRDFVTMENLDRYYLLAKELGAGFIRILEPRMTGRFSGKNILLDNRQTDMIETFMLTRNSNPAYKKYPIILYAGYHLRRSGCYGAGNRYLFIDSAGEFHACPFCRKPLGNVLTESLDTGIMNAVTAGCQLFRNHSQKINKMQAI